MAKAEAVVLIGWRESERRISRGKTKCHGGNVRQLPREQGAGAGRGKGALIKPMCGGGMVPPLVGCVKFEAMNVIKQKTRQLHKTNKQAPSYIYATKHPPSREKIPKGQGVCNPWFCDSFCIYGFHLSPLHTGKADK